MLRQLRSILPGLLAVALLCDPASVRAQGLTDSGQELPGVWAGGASWADRDNDGDLDLAIHGETVDAAGRPARIARLFDNDAGLLTEAVAAGAQLVGVGYGDAAWADYDGDGDLDLAVAGWDSTGQESLRLYANEGGVLALDLNQDGDQLRGVRYAALAWADYDGDGDLDLLVTGMGANGTSLTVLYRNTEGMLQADQTNSESLVSLHNGDLAWADYDGDGDLDLAVSGENVTTSGGLRSVTELYRNDPVGTLTLDGTVSFSLKVHDGGLAWADYDGDGNLDLAVSGIDDGWSTSTLLYRNRPAGFLSPVSLGLIPSWRLAGDLAWIDFDADGDADLALSGRTSTSVYHAAVLANTRGAFSVAWSDSLEAALAGGRAAWGDYDEDGRPDLVLTGVDAAGIRRTRLLQNAGGAVNDRPAPPVSLNPASVTSRHVLFSWPPGTDAQGANLTYNLRVGARPGGGDILSGAGAPGPGNAGFKNAKVLERSLPRDTYYWSVQTVDAAHARSEWSQEDVLNVEQFASSDQRLRDLSEAAMAWGDYDGDGDPDLVLSGQNRSGEAQSLLYTNEGGMLRVVPDAGLAPLRYGDVAWGDYDGDGDLDLMMTGEDTFGQRRSLLYRAVPLANGKGLELVAQPRGLGLSAAEWGDFDNDGDLDLVLMGLSDEVAGGVQQSYTVLLANGGDGSFTDTRQELPGLRDGDLAAADCDLDGDLDLAATGASASGDCRLAIYLNNGGRLADAGLELQGLRFSDVAWGDYDGDGDPDLVAAGTPTTDIGDAVTVLYANQGAGRLAAAPEVILPGVVAGALAWGDYDNDRDLDLVVAGDSVRTPILRLFRNTSGNLIEDHVRSLTGIGLCDIALVDIEGDGDLDLVSAGQDGADQSRTAVNENLEAQFNPNRPPEAPAGLAAADTADAVTLSWQPAADDGEDSPASLSYNLRVGTTLGGNEVLSGNTALGQGNAGSRLSHLLRNLTSGTYYWSTQTVDDGLARSAWSPDKQFVIDTVPPRVSGVTLNQEGLGIGQTLTAALTLLDEHSGIDPRVQPQVVARLGGQEYPLAPLQFTGATWSGALVIAASLPSGIADLIVRGAVDAKGNPLEPFTRTAAFLVDTALPAVAGSAPANGQTEVPVDLDEIAITFSEPLDPGGVSGRTFELELGSQILSQVPEPQYDAATNTVRFRPIAGMLQSGSEYKVVISASIQDLAGNRPENAITLSFATRVPRLLSTWPTDGDSLVAGSQPLTATFDALLLASALDDEGVVRLTRDGRPVTLRGPPAYDAQAHGLTFEPAEGLKPGSRYEVVLSGALTGPLGAQRTGDLSWSFITATPELASWEPADTTVVDADQFRAVFTGPIDVDLLSTATVQVTREGEAQTVSGLLFDSQARTLTFEVAEGLRPGSRYRVLLSGLLGGPVRVARGGNYGWEFQTPIPQVVDLQPAADSEEINPATAAISATFSQPLDGPALQATGAATVLAGGTELDLAGVEYNPETRTVRLEVAAGLRTGTAYEVRLAAAAGGPLRQADYLWRFRTAVPRLVSVIPAADATDVAVELPEALLQFTVPVDEDQAVPANFVVLREGQSESLRNGDPDHRGSGQYALAPAAGWQVGSRYTVQISSAVAGPLGAGQPLSWTFSTAVPETLAVTPA
ncbi:MAG: Ig-like domain-containing protein, partial [Candidatus Latescibacterota bacterium]